MRAFTQYDDKTKVRYTVSFVADEFTLITTVDGDNDWDDELIIHTANQNIRDYLGFGPYHYCYEIEVTNAEAL